MFISPACTRVNQEKGTIPPDQEWISKKAAGDWSGEEHADNNCKGCRVDEMLDEHAGERFGSLKVKG